MLTRRQLRAKVLQAMYALQVSGNSPEEVFNQLLGPVLLEIKGQTKGGHKEQEVKFLQDLFYGAAKHRLAYEELLASSLQNWDLSRIAVVDRAILLLGLHELLCFADVPVKVTINEYLDLAKVYSTEKSSQFINGLLDALLQTLQQNGRIAKTGRGLLDADAGAFIPIPN